MAVPIGLQNLRAFDVTINDLGLILGASQTVLLTSTFDSDYLRASSNLYDSIFNDDVLIYDGTISLTKQESLDFMIGQLAGAEKVAVEEVATFITNTAVHAIIADDSNITVVSGVNTVAIGLAETITTASGHFSGALTVAGSPVLTDSSLSYIHTQSSPASNWSITHNLNSENPVVQIYNTQDVVIEPNQIFAPSANALTISFNQAVSGTAVVLKVGGGNVMGLANVVEDLTPELGGHLATRGYSITSTGVMYQSSGDNFNISAGIAASMSAGSTLTLSSDTAMTFSSNSGEIGAFGGSTVRLDAPTHVRFSSPVVTGTEYRTGGTVAARSGNYAHSLTVSGIPVRLAGAGGGITAVVEDLTPSLGGHLNVNGKSIRSFGAGNDISIVSADAVTLLSSGTMGIVSAGIVNLSSGGGNLNIGAGSTNDVVISVNSGGEVTIDTDGTGTTTDGFIRTGLGNAGGPTYSFLGDFDTGLYRPAQNALGITTSGIRTLVISGSHTDNPEYIRINQGGDGKIAEIANRKNDESGYGDLNIRGKQIEIQTDDTNKWIRLQTTGQDSSVVLQSSGAFGAVTASAPGVEGVVALSADGDYGEVSIHATGSNGEVTLDASGPGGQLNILSSTTIAITTVTGVHSNAPFRANNGTAGTPSHSFTAATGTGMYRAGTNILGFSAGGIERLTVSGANGTTSGVGVDGNITGKNIAANRGVFDSSLTVSGVSVPIGPRVDALNSLTGNVTLAQGSNITITPAGNTLTIASTAAGSGSPVNALIGSGGITIVSGSNTTLVSAQTDKALQGAGGLTVISGSAVNILSTRIADAIIGTGGTTVVSGAGQVQVASQIDKALVGSSFINVLSGTNTNTIIADAIISDSALLVVTSGSDRVTLSPDTTPSFTSVDATTGTFTTNLTISGASVMHTGITGVTVSGVALTKGQLNLVGSRAGNVGIVGNTITFDAPPAGTGGGGGGGITSVSQDTNPSLGGNLNAGGFDITGGDVYQATTITGTTGQFSNKVSAQSGEFPYSLTVSGKPVHNWSKEKFVVANSNGPAANVVLTNMAAAANFFGINGARGAIQKVDAAGKCQVRMQGNLTVSGVVNAAARLRAKTEPYTQTIANYTDVLVTGSLMLTMKKEMVGAWQDTGWQNLRPEFRHDGVFFCVSVSGGDGAADPAWGGLYWEIR